MKIFVSIASYRDSQLIPTIQDFMENESKQHTIIYGICLQDTTENHLLLKQTFPSNLKIIYMHYSKAKGVCHARKLLQDSVTDEDYILQMDSHMRSIPNWDVALLHSIRATKCAKSLLSSYPPHYALDDTAKSYLETSTFMNVTKLNLPVRKMTTLHGCAGDYLNTTGVPIRNIHIAGGFYFAPREWIKDSPYPGDLYFEGEEDQMTVLSYTHGWTVFCPEKAIVYHSYTNNLSDSPEKYRPLHWEDHPGGGSNKAFNIRDVTLGNKRSIENYFMELNQFTDNYKQLELPTLPSYDNIVFWQLLFLDASNKALHTQMIHKIEKNVANITTDQQTLHQTYKIEIVPMVNDIKTKSTTMKEKIIYSFV